MINITIGNSYSRIEGLTSGPFNNLKKVLSYQDSPQAAYFGGFGPRRRYLIDNKGNFPTGLLGRVVEFLEKDKIESILKDTRIKPTSQPGMFKRV